VPPEFDLLPGTSDDATLAGLPTWLLRAPLKSWTDRTQFIENMAKEKDITAHVRYKLVLDTFHTVSQMSGVAAVIQIFAGRCLDYHYAHQSAFINDLEVNLSVQTEGEYYIVINIDICVLIWSKGILNFNKVTAAHSEMQREKKWKLKTGKIVEDTLLAYGKTCLVEHPCHSFILDTRDESYLELGIFTKEEIRELEEEDPIVLPQAPLDVSEYLKNFKQSTTEELRKALFSNVDWCANFDRKKDFHRDWVRKSIDLFIGEYEAAHFNRKDNLEAWNMLRVWSVIDRIFDDIDGLITVRGESPSIASSSRKNEGRFLPSTTKIQRKQMGRRADLILRRDETEFGCGEAGKMFEGINSTKTLVERGLKSPKMMKDMRDDLLSKTSVSKHRQIKTIGYIHSGLTMQLIFLDSPRGYVSRLTRSMLYRVPENVNRFANDLLPLLAVIIQSKLFVQNMCAIVDDEDEDIDLSDTFRRERLTTPPVDLTAMPKTMISPSKRVQLTSVGSSSVKARKLSK
jgi:hypothetical protein